jgi:hypothetical protein
MECALPLVEWDKARAKLRANPATLTLIAGMERVRACSIIGPYRSGKSSLLNMLMGHSLAFSVGSTTNAHTKGLWMNLSQREGQALMLIDCEGLGSLESDAGSDFKLCLLALLATSALLYNSVGVIDEPALAQFEFLVEIANRVPGRLARFPRLLWLLRDFTLELCDREGQPLTEDQYLEMALAETRTSDSKNQTRALIKRFFTDRECLTFVRPLLDESGLQNLSGMPISCIRPEFTAKVKTLSQRLHCMSDMAIDGKAYCRLIETVVKSINDDNFLELKSITHLVQEEITYRAIATASEAFALAIKDIKLPMEESAFKQAFRSKAEAAFAGVRKIIL